MRSGPIARLGLVTAAALALLPPFAARGQEAFGSGEGLSDVRGELVRLPDARADLRIVWPDPDAVPEGVWASLDGPSISIVDRGAPEAVRRVEELLGDRGDGVDIHIEADAGTIDGSGVEVGPGVEVGAGVEVESGGEVRLVWRGRTEAFAVGVLSQARAAAEDFGLTVRMPHSGVIGDMWGLQAELSRAGIRRVRFVAGP